MMAMDHRTEASPRPRVLIVAPNEGEGLHVERCLNLAGGFETVVVTYAAGARANLRCLRPHLVLLTASDDVRQGIMALKQLGHLGDLPMVICSENDSSDMVIRGLESGAREYVVMPVEPAELAARLHAVLRRSHGVSSIQRGNNVIRAGELLIHVSDRRVVRNGMPIDLTPIEFRLLVALVRRPGQLVSHEQLLTEVWGPQYTDCPHYVRLYMRYLRVKIEDNPHAPVSLISEWGMGYRFQPRETQPAHRRSAAGKAAKPSGKRERHARRDGYEHAGVWLPPANSVTSHSPA